MSPVRNLVYIHGFNSSPQSTKACLLASYLQSDSKHSDIDYHVPELPYEPQRSIKILESLVQSCLPSPIGLIGSSLGGYYGTWIAERCNLPLALINPAVRPYELFLDYLGENENWYTGEKYMITTDHIDQWKAFDVATITRPERYLLLTQTGDDVLDYREAVEKYRGCRQCIQEGGSHNFDEFETMIPTIMEFFDGAILN